MKRELLPDVPWGYKRLSSHPANPAGVAEVHLTCVAVTSHPAGAEELVCVYVCNLVQSPAPVSRGG